MKPAAEKPPRLTRNELGRYIVADLIDDLANMECTLVTFGGTVKVMRRQAENALAALNAENKDTQ